MFNINMQQHKPLRELVYEELRLLIMTGQIKPGTRMMEIELAESMGVSRTPVREAIRQLEKDNLVTIEPRKGAYVSDISAEDFESMMVVREPLEGLAALRIQIKISLEDRAEQGIFRQLCRQGRFRLRQEHVTFAGLKPVAVDLKFVAEQSNGLFGGCDTVFKLRHGRFGNMNRFSDLFQG